MQRMKDLKLHIVFIGKTLIAVLVLNKDCWTKIRTELIVLSFMKNIIIKTRKLYKTNKHKKIVKRKDRDLYQEVYKKLKLRIKDQE